VIAQAGDRAYLRGMRKGVRIVAVLLTLALAPAAGAESLSYVEGGNVFISTSDGARRVPITSAGTNDDPYILAGHADSGRTIASYGPLGSETWFIFNPDGTNSGDGPNLVPMKNCGNPSVGPISPRLHPDGDIVAFNYFCNQPLGGGYTLYLALDLPKYYTMGSNSEPLASDLFEPTFFGKRLVVEGGGNIGIQSDEADNPFHFPPTFNDWILPDAGEHLVRAEVARPGGRLALDYDVSGVKKIAIGTFANVGEFTTACILDTGGPSDGTFSPDGTKLAWVDSGGVKVGQVDLTKPGCIADGSVKTLSAAGDSPRWSAYTIPEPVQNTTGGGGTGGQTNTTTQQQQQTQVTGPPAPTISVALAATAKLKQLVKGLVVGYDVNGAGVIDAALLMPAKQAKKLGVARVSAAQVKLASARKTVAAAGKGKLTLKLTKKAKKRAKRLKGRTLTLRTTFTPKAGTPVVAVKKLRIR
jgi:hypothetical protein